MIFLTGLFLGYLIAGVATVFLIGWLNGLDYTKQDEYDGDVIVTSITIWIWPVIVGLIAYMAIMNKISSWLSG